MLVRGGERVDAVSVGVYAGAQDAEVAAGQQAKLCAGDEPGELPAVGDGHKAVSAAVQHERREGQARQSIADVVPVPGVELSSQSVSTGPVQARGESRQQSRTAAGGAMRTARDEHQ